MGGTRFLQAAQVAVLALALAGVGCRQIAPYATVDAATDAPRREDGQGPRDASRDVAPRDGLASSDGVVVGEGLAPRDGLRHDAPAPHDGPAMGDAGATLPTVVWGATMSSVAPAYFSALAVGPLDAITLGGNYTGSATITTSTSGNCSATVGGGGGSDVVLARFGNNGAKELCKALGSPGEDRLDGLVVDASGNTYVSGSFSAALDLGGPGLLNTKGGDDIFIASFTANGGYRWQRAFGSAAGLERGWALAFDAAGSQVLMAGATQGIINFGAGLTKAVGGGERDLLLTSYAAATGTFNWGAYLGTPGQDEFYGVAVGPGGAIAAIGQFSGSFVFAGNVLSVAAGSAVPDALVARFGSDGAQVQARVIGGTGTDVGQAVALDSKGNLLVGGWFQNVVDFGDGAGAPAGLGWDAFLAKYDQAGQLHWKKIYTGGLGEHVWGIAIDGLDNIYVVGDFSGSSNLGAGSITSQGTDSFVVAYDPNGVHRWSRVFASPGEDSLRRIALDSQGRIVVAGACGGEIVVDTVKVGVANKTSGCLLVLKP